MINTVGDLIKQLEKYNHTAKINVVVQNTPHNFSIAYGSSEGCTPENCDSVSLYIDGINIEERMFQI